MRSWVLSAGLIAPVSDEADQALGEVWFLRPGGQPDGQPPGGEVVDGAAPAVRGGDAVADEALVHGQVWQRPVLGQPVGRVLPGVLGRYLSSAWLCGLLVARRGCRSWRWVWLVSRLPPGLVVRLLVPGDG